MKCQNCGYEEPKVLFDETTGAVFVALFSDNDIVFVWPASRGIKKYKGCVEFGEAGREEGPFDEETYNALKYWKHECDEIYFDHPKAEEAWLVKPLKDGYEWERVDDQIGFSNVEHD